MISFVLYTYICIFCKFEWKLKTTFSTKSNPLCQKTNATIYYCPGTLLDKLSVPQRNLLNDSATSPLNEHTLDSFFLQGATRRASCYCCTDLIIELHYCFIRIWIEKSILVQLHNWVWNLVKKTSVNLSYTMQLRHATKHRTKYIKNILGQPVHTKELIYVQLHNWVWRHLHLYLSNKIEGS